jgi:hypothetical protein
LGYGQLEHLVDDFLGSIGSPDHPPRGRPTGLKHAQHGFTYAESYTLTPGRIKDLYQAGGLDIHTANTLVVDEADMTLDMGRARQWNRPGLRV